MARLCNTCSSRIAPNAIYVHYNFHHFGQTCAMYEETGDVCHDCMKALSVAPGRFVAYILGLLRGEIGKMRKDVGHKDEEHKAKLA